MRPGWPTSLGIGYPLFCSTIARSWRVDSTPETSNEGCGEAPDPGGFGAPGAVYRALVKRPVPEVTVERLPLYLQCLDSLDPEQTNVASDELAALAGVNPAKVRKDLSYLGTFGVRGVGYDVEHLRFQIRVELGLESDWPIVIVGVGNLGRALASYGGFGERGFRVMALFDVDPEKVGTSFQGTEILPLSSLAEVVQSNGPTIGVVATPASAAQEVATAMAEAGIRSVLNFAPVVLDLPDHIGLRTVDLSTELQVLSFYLHRQDAT